MKKLILIFASIVLITMLTSCGYTQSDLENARKEGYDSGYNNGYEAGYDKGYEEAYYAGYKDGSDSWYESNIKKQPLSQPASGTILSGMEYYDSKITVTADSTSSYVVSLKNTYGIERLSFFVRAGETVTVGVPAEYLYVYFASGYEWYGYGEGLMFGDNTVYSKDDDMLDFTQYTWSYTLYPVYDGNFSETPSNEDEFFG